VQNEESGVVTSLPVLFETRVVDVLLNLKEIVNEPYEEMLAEVHQELRETAKTHFAVLLEVRK
jgi:formiminotetrahydrofolate cyclodeaminase